MSKATKIIRRYENELTSPGPLSEKIRGIFGKNVDDYETRRRLYKSLYTRKKNLKKNLMTKKAQQAVDNIVKKAEWETQVDYKDPYSLGIFSKKQGENNAGVAGFSDIGSGISAGAILGGAVKGTTGKAFPGFAKDTAQGKGKDTIKNYQKQVGIDDARKTYRSARGAKTPVGDAMSMAAKKLNPKLIAKNIGKGALIGGAIGGAIKGSTNLMKYYTGKSVATKNKTPQVKVKKS